MADVDLLKWAKAEGATIDGIAPHSIAGRGRGMFAQRHIEKGENLIHVPTKCLLTIDGSYALPPELMASIDQCSVHGQLAARLCFMLVMMNDAKPWMDVMPTPEDFEHCMPLVWPLQLRQKLSEGAQKLLEKQKKKFEHDLNIVRPKFYSVLQELDPQRRKMGDIAALHTHAWLLVNSRCFYWDYPNSRGSKATAKIKKMRQDRNDCMALCPVLDCFNHSSTEDCEVTFNSEGYTVKCLRDAEAGEELFVSYGQHSNDFLLVEYGFIMDNNVADHVLLDKHILSRLSTEQIEALEEAGFLGNYVLDPESGICHRTEVALRITCQARRKWERFVRGADDGLKEDVRFKKLTEDLLLRCKEDAQEQMPSIEDMDASVGDDIKAELLERRWQQIDQIIGRYLERDKSANAGDT